MIVDKKKFTLYMKVANIKNDFNKLHFIKSPVIVKENLLICFRLRTKHLMFPFSGGHIHT